MKCSWVKCSESLSKRVSNIIRRYIDHVNFAACRGFRLLQSFIFFWFHSFLSFYEYVWLHVLYASV